jgi:hypothetical protein
MCVEREGGDAQIMEEVTKRRRKEVTNLIGRYVTNILVKTTT